MDLSVIQVCAVNEKHKQTHLHFQRTESIKELLMDSLEQLHLLHSLH